MLAFRGAVQHLPRIRTPDRVLVPHGGDARVQAKWAVVADPPPHPPHTQHGGNRADDLADHSAASQARRHDADAAKTQASSLDSVTFNNHSGVQLRDGHKGFRRTPGPAPTGGSGIVPRSRRSNRPHRGQESLQSRDATYSVPTRRGASPNLANLVLPIWGGSCPYGHMRRHQPMCGARHFGYAHEVSDVLLRDGHSDNQLPSPAPTGGGSAISLGEDRNDPEGREHHPADPRGVQMYPYRSNALLMSWLIRCSSCVPSSSWSARRRALTRSGRQLHLSAISHMPQRALAMRFTRRSREAHFAHEALISWLTGTGDLVDHTGGARMYKVVRCPRKIPSADVISVDFSAVNTFAANCIGCELATVCAPIGSGAANPASTTAENAGVRKTGAAEATSQPPVVAKLRPRPARILPEG